MFAPPQHVQVHLPSNPTYYYPSFSLGFSWTCCRRSNRSEDEAPASGSCSDSQDEQQWTGIGGQSKRTHLHSAMERKQLVISFRQHGCWNHGIIFVPILPTWTRKLASLPFHRVTTKASDAIFTTTGRAVTVALRTKLHAQHNALMYPCRARQMSLRSKNRGKIEETQGQFILLIHAEHPAADHWTDSSKLFLWPGQATWSKNLFAIFCGRDKQLEARTCSHWLRNAVKTVPMKIAAELIKNGQD